MTADPIPAETSRGAAPSYDALRSMSPAALLAMSKSNAAEAAPPKIDVRQALSDSGAKGDRGPQRELMPQKAGASSAALVGASAGPWSVPRMNVASSEDRAHAAEYYKEQPSKKLAAGVLCVHVSVVSWGCHAMLV